MRASITTRCLVASEAAERREASEARELTTDKMSEWDVSMYRLPLLSIKIGSFEFPGRWAATAPTPRLRAGDSMPEGPDDVDGSEEAIASEIKRYRQRRYG